jgi:hypothetical protein
VVFFEVILIRIFSSSVGDRKAAFDRVMELRMRLNCFSSSDCGFEPFGVTVPRLSSVGRCKRLAGDSTCCFGEVELIVEVGLEEKEVGRDCDTSCAGGRGAGLEGGVKEREDTGDVSNVGGVGAGLEGGETDKSTGDTSVVGGTGAVLEGGEGAVFARSPSFLGGGGGLVGGAIVQVFSVDDSSSAGDGIFSNDCDESSAWVSEVTSASVLVSGVPHRD